MTRNLYKEIRSLVHPALFRTSSNITIHDESQEVNFENLISDDEMINDSPIRPSSQIINTRLLLVKTEKWRRRDLFKFGTLHRLDGPAMTWREDNGLTHEKYCMYGMEVPKSEWQASEEVERHRRLTRSSNQGEGVDL